MSPVFADHIFTVLSSLPLAIISPSGWTATAVTLSWCPVKVEINFLVSSDQILRVWSSPPLTKNPWQGLKATELIPLSHQPAFSCPCKLNFWFFCQSQTITVNSLSPLAKNWPSWEKVRHLTSPSWPSKDLKDTKGLNIVKTLVNQDFSALPDVSGSVGDYFIPEITFSAHHKYGEAIVPWL